MIESIHPIFLVSTKKANLGTAVMGAAIALPPTAAHLGAAMYSLGRTMPLSAAQYISELLPKGVSSGELKRLLLYHIYNTEIEQLNETQKQILTDFLAEEIQQKHRKAKSIRF